MQKKLYLINRDNGNVVNSTEYNPFEQGAQERATKLLSQYRDRWYSTRHFQHSTLDIKEL